MSGTTPASPKAPPMPVATTGEFASSSYWKFSITKQDLADLVRNYQAIENRVRHPSARHVEGEQPCP